jgi:hypothetical protein
MLTQLLVNQHFKYTEINRCENDLKAGQRVRFISDLSDLCHGNYVLKLDESGSCFCGGPRNESEGGEYALRNESHLE